MITITQEQRRSPKVGRMVSNYIASRGISRRKCLEEISSAMGLENSSINKTLSNIQDGFLLGTPTFNPYPITFRRISQMFLVLKIPEEHEIISAYRERFRDYGFQYPIISSEAQTNQF